MAKTLNVTTSVEDTTDGPIYGDSAVAVTTVGDGQDKRILTIGTSEETITIADDVRNTADSSGASANGPRIVRLQNRDTTNYVDVGFATTVYPIRLRPGGPASVIELAPAGFYQLFMRANTAACRVDMNVFEG